MIWGIKASIHSSPSHSPSPPENLPNITKLQEHLAVPRGFSSTNVYSPLSLAPQVGMTSVHTPLAVLCQNRGESEIFDSPLYQQAYSGELQYYYYFRGPGNDINSKEGTHKYSNY